MIAIKDGLSRKIASHLESVCKINRRMRERGKRIWMSHRRKQSSVLAVTGLIFEGVFIAMLTQRFFGR